MTSKSELIQPSQFTVEIDQPEEIYKALVMAERERLRTHTEDPIPVIIGHTTYAGGLFSSISSFVDLFPKPQGAFYFALEAYNPHAHTKYWQEGEIKTLRHRLAQSSGAHAVQHIKAPDGDNLLFVDDSLEGVRHIVFLGWENERERWKAQVTHIDQHRRVISDPEEREILEHNLRQLIQSPYPSDEPSDVFIASTRIDADIRNPQLETILQLQGEVDFTRKLTTFAKTTQRIISTIAQLKGMPQTGVLMLQPPIRGK